MAGKISMNKLKEYANGCACSVGMLCANYQHIGNTCGMQNNETPIPMPVVISTSNK